MLTQEVCRGLGFTFLIYSQVVLLVQRHTLSIKILADSWALLAKPKSQEVGAGLRVPPRGPLVLMELQPQ